MNDDVEVRVDVVTFVALAVLRAAFFAAEEGSAITQRHLHPVGKPVDASELVAVVARAKR